MGRNRMHDDKNTEVNADLENSNKENADVPEFSQEQNKKQIKEADSKAQIASASESVPLVTGKNSSTQQAAQNQSTDANKHTASPNVGGRYGGVFGLGGVGFFQDGGTGSFSSVTC